MTLGLSSLIGELTSAISLITFNLIILRIDGNTGVAAYGIVANVALIATSIFTGISQGIQPLSSEYYGKGDMTLVNRILRYSMTTTIIFAVLIYTTVYIFTNQIVAIFNSEHNMKLMIIASQGMKIYFLGYLFAGINIVSSAFFSSISIAKQGMTISILRSALILIPTVLLLSTIFKMDGIWYSFVITELVVFIISSIFLIKMKNKYKEVV